MGSDQYNFMLDVKRITIMIWPYCQATGLKHYPVTGKVSTVFALTDNGEFVLNGPEMDRKMLR